MFTYRSIVLSIVYYGYLANANITLITPPSQSTTTTTISNSNLTCAEFCAITQQLVVEDSGALHRDNTLDNWIHQRRHGPSLNEVYLRKSSIIFGLSQLAEEDALSNDCYGHMKEISKAVLDREVWAMKVLDSSGTKESGFLWGHNYWLGSRHGCEAVQNPVYITLSDQYERAMKMGLINELAPFPMEYRVIYVKHNSPWQVEIKFMSERIIHIGMCLPKSCESHEIFNLTQTYLDSGLLEEDSVYDIRPEVVHIKDLKLDESFINKKSLKIVCGFLLFTFLMVVISLCQTSFAEDNKSTTCTRTNDNFTSNDGSLHQNNTANNKTNPGRVGSEGGTFLYGFIKCFDLYENCRSLFSLGQKSENPIPVINGLRSVSCLWILVFHVIWYMYFTVDNKTFLVSYGERVFFQYVSTAPLLVDVFFTISGFLSAYNFLRNEKKMNEIKQGSILQNVKSFGKLTMHRYLRLAPLYLILIGMVEIFTAYAEDVSLFHIHERYDQTCSKYWWRNVLFIQNFFHQEELCLNWTWSLACEMQFFMLATILLFFYARNPERAKTTFALGLASSIAWSYMVGYRSQYQLSFDVIYHTGTQIYINPFIRIMPYLIGMGAGWFLATRQGQIDISPSTEKCYWNVAILIFFSCIYSTVKRDMSLFWTLSLFILGRLSFSLAVSWMILGSATGRGVWWSRFLEWRAFQHLNKLSYSIYLLNPFIISIVFSSINSSTHADPILLCVLTSGFVVIVYICSIVFSLSFEIPYCNLSSQLLRRKAKTA